MIVHVRLCYCHSPPSLLHPHLPFSLFHFLPPPPYLASLTCFPILLVHVCYSPAIIVFLLCSSFCRERQEFLSLLEVPVAMGTSRQSSSPWTFVDEDLEEVRQCQLSYQSHEVPASRDRGTGTIGQRDGDRDRDRRKDRDSGSRTRSARLRLSRRNAPNAGSLRGRIMSVLD